MTRDELIEKGKREIAEQDAKRAADPIQAAIEALEAAHAAARRAYEQAGAVESMVLYPTIAQIVATSRVFADLQSAKRQGAIANRAAR